MTNKAEKKTILCVDDEPDILDSLYDTFMDKFIVRKTTSVKEALSIFNNEDIFLVISDQRMPQMEGTEFLEKINAAKPTCKKILLTGYSDINVAINAINNVAVDKYFSKPWDTEELIATVEDLLKKYNVDNFFKNAISDIKALNESAIKANASLELFEEFLGSYPWGVCIVDRDDNIQYINISGLNILKYTDISQVKGKNFKEIFLLTDSIHKKFQDKHGKQDLTPEVLESKMSDGSLVTLLANVIFIKDKDGICVNGVVFQEELPAS